MGAAQAVRDHIGPRIGVLREQRGISHSDLVRLAKLSSASLSNYESGKRRVPAIVVEKVASALGVSICALYGVEEGHAGPPAPSYADLTDAERGVLDNMARELVGLRELRTVDWQPGRVRAVEPTDAFQPTRADYGTRAVLRDWPHMTDEQRQEWLDFADAIRREQGEGA